jgi:hypothetical protein
MGIPTLPRQSKRYSILSLDELPLKQVCTIFQLELLYTVYSIQRRFHFTIDLGSIGVSNKAALPHSLITVYSHTRNH